VLAIIDSDSIVYRGAGAAQKRDPETGNMEYQPVSHALQNAKKVIIKILERTNCTDYKLFLTASNDKTCFRTNLYPEYKANRKRLDRPRYYHDVREYLTSKWGATIVSSIEADDIVCMEQYKAYNDEFGFALNIDKEGKGEQDFPAVLCGIDKDLDQVPGLHYNYVNDNFYYITPLEGRKNFWRQVLAGDVADNVPRIKKGWRKDKAFELIENAQSEHQLICIVEREYRAQGFEFPMNEIMWRGKILHLKVNPTDEFSYNSPSDGVYS
jgi:hypothetical protein